MIVKNEETNLKKSLSAASGFVDEIIIVDTGSTDNTVAIAKEFNAKIFHYVWNNNYSAARNFALKQASCDWVLNLDADHVLLWKKNESLKQVIQEPKILGLMINERTHNPDNSFYEVERLLLFRNRCNFKYSGPIFEHPLKSIKEYAQKNKITQPFRALDQLLIDHYKNHIKTSERHLPVLKKATKENQDNYDYRFKLLMTCRDRSEKDFYKNTLLDAVYRIEQKEPLLNESIVAIWGLFGEWVIKDNNTDDLEKFYKSAKTFTEKTKWNDIRLVWPYVKVSIMQKNFDNAISDLQKCVLNGIAPENVYLTEGEYIAPVFQLIKLINSKEPVEDFIMCINRLTELIANTKLNEQKVYSFIKQHDPELFEEIYNILSEAKRNEFKGIYTGDSLSQETKPEDLDQPQISLCMIIKDEQNNLEHCLKSVQNVVDEIVIVDTGSTDKSIEIAQRFNSKIIYTAWHNDFSLARNLGLDQAKGKWILHLDADEELDSSSVGLLKSKIRTSKSDAINVIVRNHQPEEDIVNYLDEQQVRLFLNKSYHRFENKVHEQIIPSIAQNSGKFEESEIIINHFGYQANNKQRAERNLDLLKDELQESPQDAYLLFKLGETYKAMKQWDKAAEFLTKAISNPQGNITNEIKEVIYLRLGQISLAKDNHEAAQEYASACLRFNSKNAMAKYILAITLMYSNQTDAGIKLFMELKETQHIHGLDLSEIDTLLEVYKNIGPTEPVLN